MSLREKLIEAGARSLYESTIQELRDAEAQLPEDRYELHAHIYRQYAGEALDTFLDCLVEFADETGASSRSAERQIVEVLRYPS